jgi:pilus assembly protein Flp/PilA
MSSLVKSIAVNEDGATAIEYGLIAGLIAVAIITALTLIGTDISAMFNAIAGKIAAETPSA